MPDVQFEEDQIRRFRDPAPSRRTFAAWMVEKGWAKSEEKANMMLLAGALLAAAIAVYFMFAGGRGITSAPSESFYVRSR